MTSEIVAGGILTPAPVTPAQVTLSPVTMAELMAALPHIRNAPRTDAPIAGLCLRPQRNARAFPDRLTLTRAEGIPGERWLTAPWSTLPDGAPDPGIQVSILSVRVLDLIWRDRVGSPHPGDPIVADLDCSLSNLPEASLIQAGTAVLRISTRSVSSGRRDMAPMPALS